MIDLYVEKAYPARIVPERLLNLLELRGLDRNATWKEILQWPEWEKSPPKAGQADLQQLQLRLGNCSYPHMKLSLNRISDSDDFIWGVDTHDQRVLEMARGSDKYQKLQQDNERYRDEIENAWTAAGIDTQRSYTKRIAVSIPPSKPPAPNAAKALIIDDDDAILSMEKVILEHEGFKVITAHNCSEAMTAYEQEKPFDICLIDVMMQDRTGVDLINELRTSYGLTCPVAFITAMMDPPVRPEKNLAIIKKPFDSRELLRTVHSLMEGKDPRAG